MFENLTEKLELALKRFRGHSKITEENIQEALREIRRALLEADVNLHVARKFVDDVKDKSIGSEVKGNLLPEQLIVKIVKDELVELLGAKQADLTISPHPPTVVLVAGLQGSGKTTFCVKLAKNLRKKGRQPLLVACDVYRPAAIDQLKTLGFGRPNKNCPRRNQLFEAFCPRYSHNRYRWSFDYRRADDERN